MNRSHKIVTGFGLLLAAACLFTGGLGIASGKSSAPSAVVTYNKDIAPIVQKSCQNCHRPGQIAPMSFLSYKEVRPWAKSIREAVVERTMPPWYADPNHGEFINDRRLSPKEIAAIVAWVEGGAKEGDPKDLPPNPKFADESWTIGTPDIVLSLPVEADIPAEGSVAYKHYAVHTKFTEDKYVQLAEVKRGNPALVHHVIVSVLEPSGGPLPPEGEINTARGFGEEGAANARQGGENRNAVRANNPDGMLIGWAPGMSPMSLRPGIAKLVKKGSVLIFQMHYTTNGVAGKDRTSIGLVFSKAPVEKRFITTGASSRNLVIPAGAPHYESQSSFTFKEDSHIWGFMPHMHLRGKDFQYRLVYPDGTSKIVLNVPKYDFNWQLNYWLKTPIAAPKGSRLDCLAHHDNSANNKFNPDPTKEVRWGPQTWEEMMIGWFDYTLDGQDLREARPQAASN